MSRVDDIKALVRDSPLVRSVDQAGDGHVRLETAFLYPDGASVDVFVENERTLLLDQVLSDFGQTTQWLLDVQVKPWLSKKRQRFVEDAIRIYGVTQKGGAFTTPLDSEYSNLVDAVIRLGQACVRVADLTYTRRTSAQPRVAEELEEVLADAELDYDPSVELVGRYGKPVLVDFLVRGRRTRSAVLTWSAPNASTAHLIANETFRRWYDLSVPERSEERVTVLDDRFDSYRDDDVQRLQDVSTIVNLTDQRTLVDLLAA